MRAIPSRVSCRSVVVGGGKWPYGAGSLAARWPRPARDGSIPAVATPPGRAAGTTVARRLLALVAFPPLLVVAGGARAVFAEAVCPTVLPAGHEVDGSLREWTAPPAFVAPGGAKVWLVMTGAGLAIAADVPPGPEGGVALWVAFPPAEMPPVGYGNQFGPVELPTADACEEVDWIASDPEAVAACRAWHGEQLQLRAALARLFVRRYVVSAAGIREDHFASVADEIGAPPVPWPPCCASSRSALVAKETGLAVEALVAAAELPPSAEAPLATFSVGIDPRAGSSAVVPELQVVRLAAPLRFESEPPLVEHLLRDGDGAESLFYFLARPVEHVLGLANRPFGYQYAPDSASPDLALLELPGKPILNIAGLDLWIAPSGIDSLLPHLPKSLLVTRDGAPVSSSPLLGWCGSEEADAVPLVHEAAGCTLLAFRCEGIGSMFGAGTCGACPTYDVDVLALQPDGQLRHLLEEADNIYCSGYDVVVMEPDAGGFGFTCEVPPDEEPGGEAPEPRRFDWTTFSCASVP